MTLLEHATMASHGRTYAATRAACRTQRAVALRSHAGDGSDADKRQTAPVPEGIVFARWPARPRISPASRDFLIAVALVVIWALTGPLFHYSDTWQLVINTSTTIVTFLMVFLIQHTQNRDTLALQLKLAEVIIAMRDAENRVATDRRPLRGGA